MPHTIDPLRVAVVLCRPQIPENVGAAARAMANMGLSRLIAVSPENWDINRAARMATGSGLEILKSIQIFDSPEAALAPFGFVAGATARVGGIRKSWLTPPALAQRLLAITGENEAAIVFGSEDRGLENNEIRLCHVLVNIPTAGFSSLNLAHAVLVICYEIFKAQSIDPVQWVPRLANRHELDGMYGQLREVLTRIGFLDAENPDHWLDSMRRLFNRFPLTAREVKTIRGVFRQMDWYTERRFKKLGLKSDVPQDATPDE
ncbi:MAG: RNA methyltransferase [Deltaproteobacteria bacterium]|nr:RNA methyltransferase [Deltaproteobacteria bacterium]